MTQHYDFWLVLTSIATAFLASYAMLEVALRVRDVSAHSFRYWLTGGSAALGFGIWATHFIGMLACSVGVPLAYDPALTLASMVPAIIAAALALRLFRRRTGYYRAVFGGGVLVGSGIASMHFIGMAALKMSPGLQYDPLLFVLSWAIAVAAAIAGLAMGHRLRSRAPKLIQKVLSAGVLGAAIVGMHYTGMAAAEFQPDSASRALASGLDTTTLAAGLGVVTLLMIVLLIAIAEAGLILERSMARELEQMALHDQLTGLANRALLREQLNTAIRRAERHQEIFAVLAINLDGFKLVNDQFGHSAGDALLRDTAERLKSGVRQEDLVARLSGDEFIVLTAEVGAADEVALMASRLLGRMDQATGTSGIAIQGSIGIALFPADARHADELLRHADFALQHGKASGRSCYHFYDPAIEHKVRYRQQKLEDLRNAVARDQLTLHYQPQVDLNTGKLVGVEALVRWNHPTEGLLSPADFIPLAEEARLMPIIDGWVVNRAAAVGAQWRREGLSLRVGVNVSAQSIDHDLVSVITAALRDTGLPAADLELEITETSFLIAGEQNAAEVLAQISALGVQLSIDDFGTGYGSLVYLDAMPVNAIKIDRQFVQAGPEKRQAAAIVEALLALASALAIRVVGEGVETASHKAFLQQLHCPIAQGYLFGRPLPAADLLAFIRQHNLSVA